MLTLKEINEITFRKTNFSGYKPEDVNDFIDQVVTSFEELDKENKSLKGKTSEIAQKNVELREKLQILARKVESYREDEDGIKKALLSAQKLGNASLKEAKLSADEILEDANKKADAMIEEAKKKSADLIEEYNAKIKGKQKELEVIKEYVTDFRSNLFEIYKNHITTIEEMPDFSKEIKAKKEVSRIEEIKKVAQEAPKPVVKAPVIEEPTIEIEPEIEQLEEISEEMFTEVKTETVEVPQAKVQVQEEEFPKIDFNAYSNIPEALKKEKSEFFNTLEFGENINMKIKK
ncbi:MAG: DivIVA domain-containing protein [Clostridia bacterium]